MNTPKFKLEFKEKGEDYNEYNILFDGFSVGDIEFAIVGGDLYIASVFVDDIWQSRIGFGNWLRTFENIYVSNVLPEAEAYWHRRKAVILSTVKMLRFNDIIFEKEELID